MHEDPDNFRNIHLNLVRGGQENLISFLRIELNFAAVLREMFQTVRGPDHRIRIRRDMYQALMAIRRFEDRINDPMERAKIHAEADKLEEFLRSSHP